MYNHFVEKYKRYTVNQYNFVSRKKHSQQFRLIKTTSITTITTAISITYIASRTYHIPTIYNVNDDRNHL